MLQMINAAFYALFILAMGYYFIINLQWYSYKLTRVLFHHTKIWWHFVYFLIPFALYMLVNNTSDYGFVVVIAYMGVLFQWYRGLDKPLVWTGRVKRFFAAMLLFAIFISVAFQDFTVIIPLFLAYFIGSDVLLEYITGNPLDHIGTLIKLLVFTLVFFFVFAWFREQVCIIVCPYGRLQGVLLDKQSIVVAYDHKRGENDNGRKKFRKNEDREEMGHGDCIDCNQCVVVCPTGIDIRNGTQLECVNCTACIDACDEIMDKVGFDPGLIRYASEDNITKGEEFKFNARIKAYSAVLTIMVAVLIALLFLRSDLEATILRLPGQNFTTTETSVSNVYTFKLINKTVKDLKNVEIKLVSHAGEIRIVGGTSFVPKGDLTEGTLFIDIDKKDLESSKEKLKIGIYADGELVETTSTSFTGPMKLSNN